eukprot:TRINITY_DN1437_c0_g1_i1.p3 TRINITY_DN1437_c0_g1~~TRINITY_DN1437_c0_g1_i1.p3  ORF type:complete len:159 (-),score=56.84 TRINITY_DN1437_c0_g1_i1:22-498(-)
MLGVLRWIGVTMLFVSCQAAYRPVVIMHGMNNNVHGYQKNVVAIQAKYPGIYVTSLNVYNDASSMLTHMDKQIAAVAQAIRADPNLKHGFNFYGESQGALLARAYVTLYNDPPVYLSLIHISEPTRLLSISYAVFCLKKKKKKNREKLAENTRAAEKS